MKVQNFDQKSQKFEVDHTTTNAARLAVLEAQSQTGELTSSPGATSTTYMPFCG